MTTPSFDSLPLPEQRRAIARDAVAQIAAGSVKPQSGVYLVLPQPDLWKQPDRSLRQLYQEAQTMGGCKACALGAVLASQLNLNGDCQLSELSSSWSWVGGGTRVFLSTVTTSDRTGPGGFYRFILRYFTPEQLQTIEIAFEQGTGAYRAAEAFRDGDAMDWDALAADETILITRDQAAAAIAFGRRYDTATGRLIAIMESIAANEEGLFVP